MQTKIQKWGNSLGVRLPKQLAEQCDLKEGTLVEILVDQKKLIVKSAEKKKTLETLLANVTASNLHNEIEWENDKMQGEEIW